MSVSNECVRTATQSYTSDYESSYSLPDTVKTTRLQRTRIHVDSSVDYDESDSSFLPSDSSAGLNIEDKEERGDKIRGKRTKSQEFGLLRKKHSHESWQSLETDRTTDTDNGGARNTKQQYLDERNNVEAASD